MKNIIIYIFIFNCIYLEMNSQCNPYIGNDTAICGNSIHLQAINYDSGALFVWSCNSSFVSIYNPNSYHTMVELSPFFTDSIVVQFIFEQSNYPNPCIGFDTLNVAFYNYQEALTLIDESDSINCGRILERLNAQNAAYGQGYWYDATGNSQFYPNSFNNHPDSVVLINDVYEKHDFYWITVNGLCVDTSQKNTIRFIEIPIANAGGDYYPGLFGNNSTIKTDTAFSLQYHLHWPDNTISSPNMFSLTGNICSYNALSDTSANVVFCNYNNNPNIFILIEDNLGCTDKDTLYVWALNNTVVNQNMKSNKINIYPNPVNNQLYLRNINGMSENLFYDIYNTTGIKVASGILSSYSYINTEELLNGIYVLVLKNDIEIITKNIFEIIH